MVRPRVVPPFRGGPPAARRRWSSRL